MDREEWTKRDTASAWAGINVFTLSMLGLIILNYFQDNHIGWYWSHPFLGALALCGGMAGWALLVSQSSIYIWKMGIENGGIGNDE